MKHSVLWCCLALCLAACQPQPRSEVDGQSILDKLKGPSISGVDATMQKAAKEALDAGEAVRARQLYAQLVDRNPNDQHVQLGYANALRRSGGAQAALEAFNRLLEMNPGRAVRMEALEGKGLSLLALGDITQASRALEQVLALDGRRSRTLNAIGVLFTAKNMLPEAVAYYDEALKHTDMPVSVLNNKGLTLAMQRQYRSSIEAFERARARLAKTDKRRNQLELNEALVYGLAGNMDKAEALAKPHLSEPALYNNLGFYAKLANDQKLAKAYLNKALTSSPVHYERAWENLEALEE